MTTEKSNEVMTGLVEYVDLLIANEDAEKVFGIKARSDIIPPLRMKILAARALKNLICKVAINYF